MMRCLGRHVEGQGNSLKWEEEERILGFLVSEFIGFLFLVLFFLIYWFQSFWTLELLGFEISQLQNCIWYLIQKISIPSYQNVIPCFLEDFDTVFKVFKKFHDGSSGLTGACFFQAFRHDRLPTFWYLKEKKIIWDCLGLFEVSFCLQTYFGSHGHVRESQNLEDVGVLPFP